MASKISNTISQIKLDNEFKDKAAERSYLREHSFDPQNSLGSFSNGKWYNIIFLFFIITTCDLVFANTPEAKFTIKEHVQPLNLEANNKSCEGGIAYPEFVSDDKNFASLINSTILAFIKDYRICEIKYKKNGLNLAEYEVKLSSTDYVSIKWLTTSHGNILERIDALVFDYTTGKLITFAEILSPLAKNFLPEIVHLSGAHLAVDTSWEQFVEKINKRDIQFFIDNSRWYIVFNPRPGLEQEVIIKKMPKYLIKG